MQCFSDFDTGGKYDGNDSYRTIALYAMNILPIEENDGLYKPKEELNVLDQAYIIDKVSDVILYDSYTTLQSNEDDEQSAYDRMVALGIISADYDVNNAATRQQSFETIYNMCNYIKENKEINETLSYSIIDYEDENGVKYDSFDNITSDKAYVNIKLSNVSGMAFDANIYSALFEQDSLAGINLEKVALQKGKETEVKVPMKKSVGGRNKLFIWTNDLNPITPVIDMQQNNSATKDRSVVSVLSSHMSDQF